MKKAKAQGVDPAPPHRVVSVATDGLDTLPHNAAVITLVGICGITHRQASGDAITVAVLASTLACTLIVVMGSVFSAFWTSRGGDTAEGTSAVIPWSRRCTPLGLCGGKVWQTVQTATLRAVFARLQHDCSCLTA